MNWWLFIFIIVVLFMMVAGVVVFLIIRLKLKESEIEEAPIIINLDSNKCDKRCIGSLKKRVVGRKGRELIIMTPKDISTNKYSEEDVTFISDKTINITRGRLSNEREIIINLPRNSEDLIDEIKDNKLIGNSLSNYIESKNTENSVIAALREKSNRQDVMRLLHGYGELSKDEIARNRELVEELSKLLIKSVEKRGVSEV